MGRPIGSVNPGTKDDALVSAINALMQNIELRFAEVERAISEETYSPSNVTETRTFDADATTLDEQADVLGTLIQDMKTRGYLR